ncbi:MAG: winged helix-turn-helix domain-containing protein, partial [Armatimonadota bacterium]
SSTEFTLLEYLMRNAGRVLTRSMLLQHVWRYDFDGSDNVLDVYISYLRKKIDRDRPKSLIRTERGTGYRLGGN